MNILNRISVTFTLTVNMLMTIFHLLISISIFFVVSLLKFESLIGGRYGALIDLLNV